MRRWLRRSNRGGVRRQSGSDRSETRLQCSDGRLINGEFDVKLGFVTVPFALFEGRL